VTPPADRREAPPAAEVPAPATVSAEVSTPDVVVEATSENISADVWENTIRPALRGMARAVYAPAGFVRSTSSLLTLSVPNAVHRAKCEEQRQVVEAALAEYVGSPVGVELLDGGGDGGGGGGDGARSGGTAADGRQASTPGSPAAVPSPAPREDAASALHADGDRPERSTPRARGLAAAAAIGDSPQSLAEEPSVSSMDLPDDDDVDLDDLIDAPPESVKSPIDRLAEAFPGSELIEEAG
jgi:DNA polymerase III subunit gamma/tau